MTTKIRAHRYDRFSMGGGPKRTPQGFLRIPASITRTGIMEYRRADGSIWRELRLPAEVHNDASLATLAGAPITEDHRGMVTPDNVSSLQVGFVAEKVSSTSRLVNSELVIQKRSTIDGVLNGKFKEVSAGYMSDIELSPGTWNGEHYDAIQRNIVYNHVAIGPSNWARGGSELAIHMDSKEEDIDVAVAAHMDSIDADDAGKEPVKNNPKQRGMEMKKVKIRLDGVTYEVEIAEALAENFEASVKKLKKENEESAARLDSLQGKVDAAEEKAKDLQTKLSEAVDPANIEKAVTARVKLVEDCKKMHPEIDATGKSDKELKIAALEKVGFGADRFDGKSDAYIDGVFEAKLEEVPEPKAAKKQGSAGVDPKPVEKTERQDGEPDPYDSDAARERMIKRGQEAWERK